MTTCPAWISDDYLLRAAQRLGQVTQIPTQLFDDMGVVGEDKRWEIFFDLERWLVRAYPLVHERFSKVNVNTHGLVFTLKGTDATLKPMLLTAHQDVVPVLPDTASRWDNPPFSGEVRDGWVHGRGAFDNKALLVGIMEVMEHFCSDTKWAPRRTIVLAFGFDEESPTAEQGAWEISKHLEEVWGPDSFAFYLDEGDGMLNDAMGWGADFAPIEVAERGYMDVKVTVGIPGGHSACAPPYTAISIASDLVKVIDATPPPTSLLPTNPFSTFLTKLAAHSPTIPEGIKGLIEKALGPQVEQGDRATVLQELAEWLAKASDEGKMPRGTKEMSTSSRCVTVIKGGLKVNALPERVTFLMNNRIASSSSIAETFDELTLTMKPVADLYQLEILQNRPLENGKVGTAIGESDLPKRFLLIETVGRSTERSPIADWKIDGRRTGYDVLAETIKAICPARDGSERTVTPQLMYGMTDTKAYWRLTKQIYRFMPFFPSEVRGAHTINEAIKVEALQRIIWWLEAVVTNIGAWEGV